MKEPLDMVDLVWIASISAGACFLAPGAIMLILEWRGASCSAGSCAFSATAYAVLGVVPSTLAACLGAVAWRRSRK